MKSVTQLDADAQSETATADSIAKAISQVIGEIELRDDWNMQDDSVRACHDRLVQLLDHAGAQLNAIELNSFLAKADMRGKLIKLNERLHCVTETALAQRALSSPYGSDPFFGSWVNRGFSDLLAGQVEQWRRCGALNEGRDRIAIVGGGALPQTQFFLARALGCETLSIERDLTAAELAAALLARAGLSNARVAIADGATYDYSGYSIVIVATLVQHKSIIAEQVARSNAIAVFAPRTPVGTHSMWREAVDEEAISSAGWRLLDAWSPRGSTVASHVYRHYTS